MLPSDLAARIWHLQRAIRDAEIDYEEFRSQLPGLLQRSRNLDILGGDEVVGNLQYISRFVRYCAGTDSGLAGADVAFESAGELTGETTTTDATGYFHGRNDRAARISCPNYTSQVVGAGTSTVTMYPVAGRMAFAGCPDTVPIDLTVTDPFGSGAHSQDFYGANPPFATVGRVVAVPGVSGGGGTCAAPVPGNAALGYFIRCDGLFLCYPRCPGTGPGHDYPSSRAGTPGDPIVGFAAAVTVGPFAPTSSTCDPFTVTYSVVDAKLFGTGAAQSITFTE